jgi:hypothetical protein
MVSRGKSSEGGKCSLTDVSALVIVDCDKCGEVAEAYCNACNNSFCGGCLNEHIKESMGVPTLLDGA